jgi:hypothetical protein
MPLPFQQRVTTWSIEVRNRNLCDNETANEKLRFAAVVFAYDNHHVNVTIGFVVDRDRVSMMRVLRRR